MMILPILVCAENQKPSLVYRTSVQKRGWEIALPVPDVSMGRCVTIGWFRCVVSGINQLGILGGRMGGFQGLAGRRGRLWPSQLT